MPIRPSLYLGAACAALATSAVAQDTPLFLGTIVFASLEPVDADRTGTTVTVVTEDDLDAAGDTRVAEILARTPGINITPAGGLGARTGLTLRGAGQNYVAVLVDGIDVTDPSSTQTSFDFGQMTAAGLARIEVIPGTQSALYGSRAVGGVIAMTSRTATEDGLHHFADAEYGSFDTRRLSYGLTFRDDHADAAVTLSHVATEGFSMADAGTEADGYAANRLSFNAGYAFDSGLTVRAAGFAERGEGDYDSSFPVGDADNTATWDSAGLRLSAAFATGPVDHEIALTRYAIERRYVEAGAFPSDNTYTGTRNAVSWQGATDIGAAGRFVFGLESQTEDYDQTGTYGDLAAQTRTAAAYAELTYAVGDTLDLSFSWRHDDHETFGGFDTGRVALAWRPAEGWVVRAQASSGFRAPSNYELFSFYGDTGLMPETSRSADLGVERQFAGGGMLRATAFLLEVEDLIDFSDMGTPLDWNDDGYAQVPGLSRRTGLELVASLPVTDAITLNADYTHTRSDTNGTGAWAQVPEHVFGLGLDADVTDRISASIDLTHATDRAALPDYTVANATASYDLGNGTEAYLRIENLFDADYQLVDGYGTSDRAVYVGINARF